MGGVKRSRAVSTFRGSAGLKAVALKGRSAPTAVHEAAHAVAANRYQFGFLAVHIGGEAPSRGRCETSPFDDHRFWRHISDAPFDSEGAAMRREAGFRELVVRLAGHVAEARHRRCSYLAAALAGGVSDFDEVTEIARFLARDPADQRTLIQAADDEAKLFVRQHWDVIRELATTLLGHGSVEFDDAPPSVHAVSRLERQIAPG
jgi:hypothetical protein